MCYDISFKVNIPELQDSFPDLRFDGQLPLDFAPMDHIMGHAYPVHPIVYRTKEGDLLRQLMEWGVIPFYTKDEKAFARQRPSMLNARAERILDDPKSYWSKIQQRRCVIPVTGIYEHRGIIGWKKKVPYFVSLPEQPVFFLPGLYSVVELPDTSTGEMLKRYTFRLITRAANPMLAQIHNAGEHRFRMPLFFSLAQSNEWVSSDLSPERYRALLYTEMPVTAFSQHPVFTNPFAKIPTRRPRQNDVLGMGEIAAAVGEANPPPLPMQK